MALWKGPEWLRPQEAAEETAYCRYEECGAPIFFRKRPGTGKPHPIDPEGGSHFRTCPAAELFRSPDLDDRQPGLL